MLSFEEAQKQPHAFVAGEADIIVVGAGHAGCEAALAAARLGRRVILFTMTLDSLANLPCNPNIGGTAKGQIVREIDALGGEMGRLADQHMIQFRMLNATKGPAVMSPRAQINRTGYQRGMKRVLESEPLLTLIQQEVTGLLIADGNDKRIVEGVVTATGSLFKAPGVILCPGTFLDGRVIIGDSVRSSGPDQLAPSCGLGDVLTELGLPTRRFKTGTPGRFHRRSVAVEQMEMQPADGEARPFSFEHEDDPAWKPAADLACYITWTTERTKKLLSDNIDRSPLYSGVIEGIGPRYCPSIEDKIVKFPEHTRHHVFIEPTGLDTQEMYASGLSTSMPEEIQRAMLETIPGMEKAEIMRPAYAIEYLCVDPTILELSLEVKGIEGLFLAGQINGSSGYEEAAAQGLIAGINAVRRQQALEPLVIDRSEGYIGVLIDDLVTKGTNEPYRLMTSRAEYRLLLRQDNADTRLSPIGHEIGLLPEERWQAYLRKQQAIDREMNRLSELRVRKSELSDAVLTAAGSTPLKVTTRMHDLLKRPELSYALLAPLDPERPDLPVSVRESVEIQIRYEGYIKLENDRVARFRKLESKRLPKEIDYARIKGLRLEARQKLSDRRPESVGQASRISGVSPADIQVLLVYMEQWNRQEPGPCRTE
ncbi:MAG TPA: tRNA uridine-5-carboxymethylaminomethyl(34) synthesis enzyme MnmG [Bacillota bacterium]|nr:tRNA uridine-5-carboxymethylaminomethyl(34) synthesis enzyme MnmG [Bacillota bacterium]